jgi:hypothetical protein
MTGMHKSDALPPSVQQIMDAITGCEASSAELRELITTALDDARSDGAKVMREIAAQGWDGCMYDAPGETLDIGAGIRTIPLPTGARKAVLLNLPLPKIQYEYNKEKGYSVCAYTSDQMKEYAESCITANNLEVRRV